MSENQDRLDNHNLDNNEKVTDRPRQLRGLYRYVKISVSTLNIIIVGGIAAIVIILAIGLLKPGYKVTFDCQGGTPVESQKLMYGDTIVPPAPPTMEGYIFKGWFLDPDGNREWNIEETQIEGPTTLYAVWEKSGQ